MVWRNNIYRCYHKRGCDAGAGFVGSYIVEKRLKNISSSKRRE